MIDDIKQLVVSTARDLTARRHIPSATYRVQFSRQFTFKDAEALVPYLHDLGIGDLYASPILRAVPGSAHGYDICDHGELNPELGSREGFDSFVAALHARGMHLIVDIVPNHMGVGHACNAWWMDVLENGPSSIYAGYFDIDWSPVKPELVNKVLLPILEDQYGRVLEDGKLKVACSDGAFTLHYGDHELPIAPETYIRLLEQPAVAVLEGLGEEDENAIELQSILTALNYLPGRGETDALKRSERAREKEVIKRRIAALYDASEAVREAISKTLERFNGTPGDPSSYDLPDDLIAAQPYRLAFWRVAAEEINYRRFFDINTMAAIRVELPEVFDATHNLIFELLAEGQIEGLRIDHPDGLWNPPEYFRRLQERYVADAVRARVEGEINDDADEAIRGEVAAWFGGLVNLQHEQTFPLYVVVEKILSETEPLPRDWAVYGTTGYDFMNLVNGIFVNRTAEVEFNAIYDGFTGNADVPFSDRNYRSKKMTMLDSLASEINSLAHQLERLAEKNRHTRDFTLNGLMYALREVIACLPIYRTYIVGEGAISHRDQHFIETAVRDARRHSPHVSSTVFNFIRDTLLLRNLNEFEEADRTELLRFVMRFQQITGPVMAKSIEDTLFYVYNRLVSLNEVGGNPAVFGIGMDEFHEQNARRRRQWAYAMLATSTHDTKRSEDVRARLNVLSEIAGEWGGVIREWQRMSERSKTALDSGSAPDANDEYLLYQSMIGAYPFDLDEHEDGDSWMAFCERISAYMAKATKEAKVRTSWTNANEEYDTAVADFIDALLRRDRENPFLKAFIPFQRRVAYFGQWNALSQVLLRLTCPGVPDTYRGTEVWDFSLVDPDNRRPVDYEALRAMLQSLQAVEDDEARAALASDLVASSRDGRIKMYTLQRALRFRRDRLAFFGEADYAPVAARGAKKRHVCAFQRQHDDDAILVVVPRLVVGLTGGEERPPLGGEVWQDTQLMLPEDEQGRTYRNLFTGEALTVTANGDGASLALVDVLGRFPVALLERVDS